MKRLLTLLSFGLGGFLPLYPLHAQTGPETDPNFSHSVGTPKKPWTNRAFKNDPRQFQFAIVTDRTGGMRPGVFPRAVAKVNELQPEFVITVGDLIAGGGWQRNETELRRQWKEFNGFVDRFDMPFFYLPGNHDVSNPIMDRLWDEQFGVRYYTFVYKDVLFLCLNTQDGEGTRPFLGAEQIAWAKAELEKHADVRWTMVFIHQPLWVFEEGIQRNVNGERVLKKSKTSWPAVEAALAGRKHTVYAGHVHRYAKYERKEANYYTLGTTGGGSALRGSAFGEFDHATWITMTEKGPKMMNLTLDGMLPDDATTEAKLKFSRGLRFAENIRETFPFPEREITLPIKNPLQSPLAVRLSWILPATDNWTVSPRRFSLQVEPNETTNITFKVRHEGDVSTYFPLPRLETHLHGDKENYHLEKTLFLPLDLTEHVKKHPAEITITETMTTPKVDGVLDDELWKKAPPLNRLIPRRADGHVPVKTEAWLHYDKTHLHVAVRCHEPLLRDVLSEATERDGAVGKDDAIELLFDTNRDKKSFHHFTVNPAGVLYDARKDDAKWNSTAKVAVGREPDAWTVELSIPLSELGADLGAHRTWGFQMARQRPRSDEQTAYQFSPTFWYGNTLPSFFGKLELR